uniref:Uncharacterized protein n=1 Tax=Noccaea caerulescens TaxID=107243 RepID=A0A1J3CQE9_NOCCA
MTVLMKTKEKAMTSMSAPPGKSKVRPFLGIPLLLSSSMLVGASGKPGFLFDFLSLSFKTSRIWLPICGFDGLGVASVYRLSTRAALSLSLAVNGPALLLLVSLMSDETEPLAGSTGFEVSLPALSESVDDDSGDVVAVSSVSELDIITNLLLLEISDLLDISKGQNFDDTTTFTGDLRTGLHLV